MVSISSEIIQLNYGRNNLKCLHLEITRIDPAAIQNQVGVINTNQNRAKIDEQSLNTKKSIKIKLANEVVTKMKSLN